MTFNKDFNGPSTSKRGAGADVGFNFNYSELNEPEFQKKCYIKNEDRDVTVYCTVDLISCSNEDIRLLAKCIEIYVNTKCEGFKLKEFKLVNVKLPPHMVFDCIHEGLVTFSEMSKILKLKEKHDVWFLYLGSGNIRSIYKNVTVMLLNEHPINKEAKYIINRKGIDMNEFTTKDHKLEVMKIVTSSLDELFKTNNNIQYDKLEYNFVN